MLSDYFLLFAVNSTVTDIKGNLIEKKARKCFLNFANILNSCIIMIINIYIYMFVPYVHPPSN